MRVVIEPMREEDIPEVTEIEKHCFNMSWPAHAYRREIRENSFSHYVVAREVNGAFAWEATRPESRRTAEAQVGGIKRAVSHLLQPFARPAAPLAQARIAGYAGLWIMLDEAHVTTICVRPELQRKGIGEIIFIHLLGLADRYSVRRVTLEVRVSNQGAQELYHKYGFTDEGIRKHYYSDNNEDALIMWSDDLHSPAMQERLSALRRGLRDKIERLERDDGLESTG